MTSRPSRRPKRRAGSGDEISFLNFKMATEARREARRRKLLQNPEDRLKKIIGSRSSHPTSSHPQLETDENALRSFNPVKNDSVDGEIELADTDSGQENELMAGEKEGLSDKRGLQLKDQTTEMGSTEGDFKSKDPETERDVVDERTRSLDTHTSDVHDNTRSTSLPQSSVLSSPSVNQTVERGRSSSESNRRRVLFNVVLAFVLVSKWTYVNLEVLLATRTGDGEAPDSSHKLLVHSEVRKQNCVLISFAYVNLTLHILINKKLTVNSNLLLPPPPPHPRILSTNS